MMMKAVVRKDGVERVANNDNDNDEVRKRSGWGGNKYE